MAFLLFKFGGILGKICHTVESYLQWAKWYQRQARNQGGRIPPRKIFAPLEKFVGHSSKNLGPSENIAPLLVSQAGCGPEQRCLGRHSLYAVILGFILATKISLAVALLSIDLIPSSKFDWLLFQIRFEYEIVGRQVICTTALWYLTLLNYCYLIPMTRSSNVWNCSTSSK